MTSLERPERTTGSEMKMNLALLTRTHPQSTNKIIKNLPLISSLLASVSVHALVFFLASPLISSRSSFLQKDFIVLSLIAMRQAEHPAELPEKNNPSPSERPMMVSSKREKITKPVLPTKREAAKTDGYEPPPAVPPVREDPHIEAEPIAPVQSEQRALFPPAAPAESGGGEATAGTLFDQGNVGLIPEPERRKAAAQRLQAWEENPAHPAFPLPGGQLKPIAKRSRFKPRSLPIRRWLCAWDCRGM